MEFVSKDKATKISVESAVIRGIVTQKAYDRGVLKRVLYRVMMEGYQPGWAMHEMGRLSSTLIILDKTDEIFHRGNIGININDDKRCWYTEDYKYIKEDAL